MFAAVCALTPHVISPRNVSRWHPVLNDILHTDRNDRCDCNVMFCNEIISIINLPQSCKLILNNKKIKCDYNMFINLIMIIIIVWINFFSFYLINFTRYSCYLRKHIMQLHLSLNYTFNLKHRYQEKHAISLSTMNDKNYGKYKLVKKVTFPSKNSKLVSHPSPFIGATKSFLRIVCRRENRGCERAE